MPTPGPVELVIILVIALLILGPGRLPDVGSALGKSIREFRKASSDVQDAVKLDTNPSADQPASGTTAQATPPAAHVAPGPDHGAATDLPGQQSAPDDRPAVPTVASTSPQDTGAVTASSEPTPGRS